MKIEIESEKIKEKLGRALEAAYPRRCPICREIIMPVGELICKKCEKELPIIDEKRCLKCGAPLFSEEAALCRRCREKEKNGLASYEHGMAVFSYTDKISASIADFKYHNHRDNADFYAKKMLDRYGEYIKSLAPEVIIPVPIHFMRWWERGYNQAALIARKLAGGLEIPCDLNYLIRVKDTKKQKDLTLEERMRNISDAFAVSKERASDKYKRVLLVDDIYTTGGTIETCSRALLNAGCEHVDFISVAIVPNDL